MPYVPDVVVNKPARFVRNAFIVAGVGACATSWMLLGTPNTGVGMLSAAGAGACFLIAAKIKTKYVYVGSAHRYRKY